MKALNSPFKFLNNLSSEFPDEYVPTGTLISTLLVDIYIAIVQKPLLLLLLLNN